MEVLLLFLSFWQYYYHEVSETFCDLKFNFQNFLLFLVYQNNEAFKVLLRLNLINSYYQFQLRPQDITKINLEDFMINIYFLFTTSNLIHLKLQEEIQYLNLMISVHFLIHLCYFYSSKDLCLSKYFIQNILVFITYCFDLNLELKNQLVSVMNYNKPSFGSQEQTYYLFDQNQD